MDSRNKKWAGHKERNQEDVFIAYPTGYIQASNKEQEKNSFKGGWQIL